MAQDNQSTKWTNAAESYGRPLRVMIVDDNHINLSVLSTLIRRRFGHVVQDAPVAVDSGLKAIQILRTHVFDCILMDIQMPFLSGLDAARRIRNAEDGILAANSDAHIVAVTTAVGDEPERAYRRAKMDGMIGKPVRFSHLQQYLCPLAHEAQRASHSVNALLIDGEEIMPPLPPVSQLDRVFYRPADATTPSSRPDICAGNDFEKLLNIQTRTSLRRLTTVVTAGDHGCAVLQKSTSEREETSSSDSSAEERVQSECAARASTSHSRNASMSVSLQTLNEQIAREMANAQLDGSASDSLKQATSTRNARASSTRAVHHRYWSRNRPPVLHRTSSPGWLLSDDEQQKEGEGNVATRPKLSHLNVASNGSSFDKNSGSSEPDSPNTPPLRQASRASSTSTDSLASSTVTTPSCDNVAALWSLDGDSNFQFDREQSSAAGTSKPLDAHRSKSRDGMANEAANRSSRGAVPSSPPHSVQVMSPTSIASVGGGVDDLPAASPPSKHGDHRFNHTLRQKDVRQVCDSLKLAQSVHQLKLSQSPTHTTQLADSYL